MELLKYLPEVNIEVGAKVPNFYLLDTNDKKLTDRELSGKPAVLYFGLPEIDVAFGVPEQG